MPRVGYKSQVLEEVWRFIEGFQAILPIDLYDYWVWDLIGTQHTHAHTQHTLRSILRLPSISHVYSLRDAISLSAPIVGLCFGGGSAKSIHAAMLYIMRSYTYNQYLDLTRFRRPIL
ncbi:hypothetical protein L211DRAFT_579782 [Terfezia boudieri ATCC MYA-4762]|uniref:Uncharacterized protein n=1 Tax=Terfezia boudieri ATCC MYA-4762 TaxID=1051890 RepID=A0A3N4LBC6_9PEZI|nr:hypothetical protein L211DRAFT_579782 [Terfezia boudieri ATCC MYA-4762]